MTLFAGIDFDTKRIDVVTIAIDTLMPRWYKIPTLGATSFDRARAVRTSIEIYLHDFGVVQVAIEQPAGQKREVLYRVQGAILSMINPAIDVLELPPWEWRRTLGLPGNGKREDVKRHAREYASAQPFGEVITGWDQDAIDAYCIARAALGLCYLGMPIDD